jgi:leucyl-tRNA synthetase
LPSIATRDAHSASRTQSYRRLSESPKIAAIGVIDPRPAGDLVVLPHQSPPLPAKAHIDMPRYNPAEIEPRWQQYWEQQQTFATPIHAGSGQSNSGQSNRGQSNRGQANSGQASRGESASNAVSQKLYVLDMFPYPSGEGLHVGHPEGYTATDIVCRHARMCGKTVLHPMGFDSFGLPAEEYAIKNNVAPRISTERNIENFVRQLKMLGFSYDWKRQLATTDRGYFRWTQWIFLLLYDTWFDPAAKRGRPIAELPIPAEVQSAGGAAVAQYQAKHRLAYQDDALVNWCPGLGTVVANEEVIDGKSEVGGHPVQRIPLRQWMLRITHYAERLLDDLDSLDWPAGIKKLQQDWIGRSTGAEVDFYIGTSQALAEWKSKRRASGWPSAPGTDALRIYTTRPDTLFGATYMVIAPEHPLVATLTKPEQAAAVEAYCRTASFKSDRERTEGDRKKTGVFTGSHAINPVNDQAIPIWIADYVLANYGTGAIMAVPAHDDRDFQFAKTFQLPIVAVVDPGETDRQRQAILAGQVCGADQGVAIHSGPYDGLPTNEVLQRIVADLSKDGTGKIAVNYKLRDWLFSRQRFWGEPFPILHELDDQGKPTGILRAVDADELPVDLPELVDFKPIGRPEPPLGKSPDDWLYVHRDGKRYKRETNTMPQWAGSCWYYLRFIDPHNEKALVDPELEKQWMPVDLYVGGAEHAVLHLLYSRFWHKVLFDRGVVASSEPFRKLINQGMILGETEYTGYAHADGTNVSSQEVRKSEEGQFVDRTGNVVQSVSFREDQLTKAGDSFVLKDQPTIRVDSRAYKMSKSRGNVVNPDHVVREYGADSLRLYEMFMGPLEATKPWSMAGVSGVRGFLDRAWRMMVDGNSESPAIHPAIVDENPDEASWRLLHRTIKVVGEDIQALSFNTAIARMMEFVNHFSRLEKRPKSCMESFVLLLSPFAPHIAEELWMVLGHPPAVSLHPWPTFDPKALIEEVIEIPVQVNGKVRSKIQVPRESDPAAVEAIARGNDRVQAALDGKEVIKTLVIPGRMISFVVK